MTTYFDSIEIKLAKIKNIISQSRSTSEQIMDGSEEIVEVVSNSALKGLSL